MLKGIPPHLDGVRGKIASALVAVRERTPAAWPELTPSIVQLLDNLGPVDRPRAIAFIAAFPNFWPLIQEATQTALQETVNNLDPANVADVRIMMGITFERFRAPLLAAIPRLDRETLARTIAATPLADLWPNAVARYAGSGSFRGSEANFSDFIAPYTGSLAQAELDQVLDAVVGNGQNYAAAATGGFLLSLLRNAGRQPSIDARNRFVQGLHEVRHMDQFRDVLAMFTADGWQRPALAVIEDED